jgi:protein involved in polysaccharide export with SLBB domain
MRRSYWWGLLLGFVSLTAFAQVPTPAQLEMLKAMPAAQRETLLQQFGIDPTALESGDSAATSGSPAAAVTAAERKEDLQRAAQALTLQPGDTVLVTVAAKAVGEGQSPASAGLVDAIRRGNPYSLDRSGQLMLPGVAPIAVGALTEEQANRRLALESSLQLLTVSLSRLPVQQAGRLGLKPFGYDIFDASPSTFAPLIDVPVPIDYAVGPGDQLSVQLYGSQNRNVRLSVNRDGTVNFPELGPIGVLGKTFDEVRADIEARVAKQMIGTQASVSISQTRSIQVFVLGEAKKPGSYTVSGLSTLTSALYAAGGISLNGSLRDIHLKRRGNIVRRLDLYDLLLRGDTSNDAKLMPGDVIFIPPVGSVASIDGEVRRPAIYELKGNVTVGNLVTLAGGLTTDADAERASLVRIGEDRRRVALDVAAGNVRASTIKLENGDALSIARIRPTLDAGIVLEGHVFRPGPVAWREGIRLTEVIRSVDELKSNADLGYVLIRRELPPDRRVVVLSADLATALRQPRSEADIILSARDRIIVFDAETGRDLVLKPLLNELRLQSGMDKPAEVVSVGGQVKAAGEYPLEPGMRISDLLRAGGRLADAAYAPKAELTRYLNDGQQRSSELLEIDLAGVLRGDAAADITLQAFDALVIKELPEWSKQEYVILRGEVRFPGRYPIRRGETLRSVVERAGGLSALAFPRGAIFTRKELREREAEQLAKLTERLQSDLAALSIQAGQVKEGQSAAQGAMAAQGLLGQLQSTKAVGRLIINVDRLIAGRIGSRDDIILRDGDELVMPKIRQEVTVLGEVQNGTSLLYRSGLSRDDYIDLSGGYSVRADKSRTYVVRADGSVVARGGNWFARGNGLNVEPGDTIVVPIDTERLPPLPLWQAVTTIVYNAAVALAAIRTL